MITTLRSTISVLALLCLTLALLFFAVRGCQQAAAEGTARVIDSTGRALGGVFGARVSLRSSGVIEAPRDIAEFAVLEHGTSVVSRYRRARIFGWFAHPYSRVLTLRLPPTRLLSLETLEVGEPSATARGSPRSNPPKCSVWPKPTASRPGAKRDAVQLRRNADNRLEARLREVLAPIGVTLRVERQEPTP